MPRGISWSFNETEALIRIWSDAETQTALRLNSRNRRIYEDIANQLQSFGITRSADQCQMRIKLLKKMYRQTNEAIKRGDVFQQRPCPFFHEMHRIFAGNEENDQSGLNSQSLNNDEENLPEDELDESEEQHEDEKISVEPTDEKFSQAIDRFIQYQKQSEARWYKYVEQQANLELQRRQEDRAYQFQLIQLLSNVIQTTCSNASSTFVQQMPASPSSSIENLPSVKVNRGEKRAAAAAASSPTENKRSKLPSNFYSLLAQIHNINDLQETD